MTNQEIINQLRREVGRDFRTKMWNQTELQVNTNVVDQLRNQIKYIVFESVSNQVGAEIWNEIEDTKL